MQKLSKQAIHKKAKGNRAKIIGNKINRTIRITLAGRRWKIPLDSTRVGMENLPKDPGLQLPFKRTTGRGPGGSIPGAYSTKMKLPWRRPYLLQKIYGPRLRGGYPEEPHLWWSYWPVPEIIGEWEPKRSMILKHFAFGILPETASEEMGWWVSSLVILTAPIPSPFE